MFEFLPLFTQNERIRHWTRLYKLLVYYLSTENELLRMSATEMQKL